MPDSRVPLPEPFTPPNGRCASAPLVVLLIEVMPASMRSLKRYAQSRFIV
jgi:hypothetical protein